jgi:hypothetical protein
MTTDKYILDERGEPVIEPDLLKWGRWFETAEEARRVADTRLENGVRVSTVFLGLDHNFCMDGPPILWETMVFGGPHDQKMIRTSSRAAAEDIHKRMVEREKQEWVPR